MPKYLIKWNAGYGQTTDVVETDTQDKAVEEAYHRWLEEAESNADYDAEALTQDNAEEYGHEDELDPAATA